MGSAVTLLPAGQLEPLRRAYSRAVAAKRLRTVLFMVLLVLALLGAGNVAQVDPVRFWEHRWDLFDYFDRCLMLDSGERVWTHLWGHDGWFWNFGNLLILLVETI